MLNSFFRITLVTTSFLFIFQPEIRGESLVNNEVCEAVRSPIVASIIEDINLLSEVSLIQLNCKSIAKINSIDDDSVLLTTTRKGKNIFAYMPVVMLDLARLNWVLLLPPKTPTMYSVINSTRMFEHF